MYRHVRSLVICIYIYIFYFARIEKIMVRFSFSSSIFIFEAGTREETRKPTGTVSKSVLAEFPLSSERVIRSA